jgi:cyclophilin family peptidyl-prolyl cis-trans isomerase
MPAQIRVLLFLFGALASFQLLAANPQVEFETSRGSFVIELYPDKAPRTVENFLKYVSIGFYDGTIFHRTIEKFLVQGGGLTEKLEPKPVLDPIPNESTNGLPNELGTVAMAHGFGSDTATSQFFVNLGDNHILNFYRHEPGLEGYTVFGRIIRGLEMMLRISEGQTAMVGRLDHVPKEPVVILSSRLLEIPVVAENALQLKAPEPIEKKPQSTKKGKKRG